MGTDTADPTAATSAPGRHRWRAGAPWVSLAARLVLGGVLLVAGILKLGVAPTEQVRAVRAYQLLPYGVDAAVGYTLPFVEIVLAAALILGMGTRVTAVFSGVLMLVFVAGIASVWARGLSIDCGCFGDGGPVDPAQTKYLEEILRDLGLTLCAAWLAVFGAGRFALDTRRTLGTSQTFDTGQPLDTSQTGELT
ncbi:MauE/DoxX family redox-associated membrane protein [Actinopolymorpha sp. B11F2]|uniref:MauE/DoxX family redox-associated membrane protein n=1 Tax=Actinopolymorpha sp. B11F2 TaxID=3160862 RepID=UPI0032E39122